jgi:DhnA family fructose-bisphosphate aldolase class Ia
MMNPTSIVDGREIRLRRLMGDGRAVVIAIDHGLFDGPIPALEDLPAVAAKINPAVDAVLLSPGMLRHCGGLFAHPKRPLAIVRLNWNTIYCFKYGYRGAKSVFTYDPDAALLDGMDLALVSLTLQTGDEGQDAVNVEIFSRLVTACHARGIPVIGEYFPTNYDAGSAEELHRNVLIGSRIVTELGADAIKTFFTLRFTEVCQSCPIPILGLGAEKLPRFADALQLARRIVEAGGSGVVFGRNAIQFSDPFCRQAALCDVVKNSCDPQEAIRRQGLPTDENAS